MGGRSNPFQRRWGRCKFWEDKRITVTSVRGGGADAILGGTTANLRGGGEHTFTEEVGLLRGGGADEHFLWVTANLLREGGTDANVLGDHSKTSQRRWDRCKCFGGS